MKKTASIAVLMLTAIVAQAQKVTFYSPEFENGVRYHIGLDESDDVLQTHTDTITTLNLSGMEITDIRDAVYLTAVTKLDLSYNGITDVSPLLSLESLKLLNLCNNHLEDINMLAFFQTGSLEVDVSGNYISDFSYFYSPTECEFTFIGMNMQSKKDAPYFDMYQFYTNVNDDNQPVIIYRGYIDAASMPSLEFGNVKETAELDGTTHCFEVPGQLTEGTLVTITNGKDVQTTYVMPIVNHKVEACKTIQIVLPNSYTISFATAEKGKVDIADNIITYTATEDAASDVVNFCYYENSNLKGFSRFFVNQSNMGDVNGDGKVNTDDIKVLCQAIMGENPTDYVEGNADLTGDGHVNAADLVKLIGIVKNNNVNN
jgi:hypothetical protein